MSRIFFLLAVILFLSADVILAQPHSSDEGTIPTLGGHRFINSKLLRGPWSNTSFSFFVGYGESNRLPQANVPVGDTVITLSDGSIAMATLGVDYEQRIQEWLSFFVRINGSARVGLDTRGLLSQGLNTFYGYEIGWKMKIWSNNKNRLAGRIGIYNYQGNFVNVYQYVSDILNNVPDPSVSVNIPALQTIVSLMYARSFGPLVGLQVEAAAGVGDTFIRDRQSSDFSYQISGAVDLNLYPKTRVPLGLSIAAGVNSLPDLALQNTGGVGIYNVKIVYTGTPDFLLSLDFTTFNLPLFFVFEENVGKVNTSNMSISIKYYFN